MFSLPQSNETSHSEAEEEKFLESLSKSFETSEKATAEITPHLTDIANKRWGKKLAPEVLKTLPGRHGKLANCMSITNVKVNPEIWGQLNASKRTKDLLLSNTHQTLQRVAFITLQMADCLLNWKDPELDKISLVSNAVDSIALLGHVANDVTTFRREQIKPALREEYRQLCSADIAPGEWLFGEDLPKRLQEIKETCLAQEVAINSRGKNYHGYTNRRYHAPKRFHSVENKGTTFLWKGQQKPKTKNKRTNYHQGKTSEPIRRD